MKDIKEIVAKNIIDLRKKNNLTQLELAEKLNYSDNAISRWERAEVTPTLETLSQIAQVFDVPMSSLIEDNAKEVSKKIDKKVLLNKLAITLISFSLVWLIAVVVYVYGKIALNANLWTIFIWACPLAILSLFPFNEYWGKYIYKFVILSLLNWSIIACIYLQFLEYNMWLIFIIGIPIQVALSIWAFVKPKSMHK